MTNDYHDGLFPEGDRLFYPTREVTPGQTPALGPEEQPRLSAVELAKWDALEAGPPDQDRDLALFNQRAEAVVEGLRMEALSTQKPSYKTRLIYASSWHKCDRYLVLKMTRGDELPPADADLLARFQRGNDRERDLLINLARAGRLATPPFEVEGQQQSFDLRDRKGRVAIRGRVDARLKFEHRGASYPLEVKAWSPNTTQGIETFRDVLQGPWTKGGAYQLLSYLLGSDERFGFLLLDRSGLPALVKVDLYQWLPEIEGFLHRAEVALDHVEAGTLPAFLQGDPATCLQCPFYGGQCNPPLHHQAIEVAEPDQEAEAELARREELRPGHEEYEALDKRVKTRYRGVTKRIVGDFVLTGKWGSLVTYEVPDEVRAPYRKENPEGRFTLTVRRPAPRPSGGDTKDAG